MDIVKKCEKKYRKIKSTVYAEAAAEIKHLRAVNKRLSEIEETEAMQATAERLGEEFEITAGEVWSIYREMRVVAISH
jgi:hypothetical protein